MARPSIQEYEALFSDASAEECERLVREVRDDPRAGVRRIREKALRNLERVEAERLRLTGLMELQVTLHDQGFDVVAGVDEVGRGALAGPVTAAAVVLTADSCLDGLDDSKRLSPQARDRLAIIIEHTAVSFAVAHVPAHIIDALGIAPATRRAIDLALARLPVRPDHVITDGHPVGLSLPETAVVRGDSSVACVAAASILAKVARDRLMGELACAYVGYRLEVNKGYGTTEHVECLTRCGPSPVHRRSFGPCSSQPTLF